jgi:glycosyltransferase involved in cell wall biosynthesis
MKVLFVAPRYHTNQVHIVRTLRERGHEVCFHVAVHGVTEDHGLLRPTVFAESRLSAIIRNVFGDGGPNRRRYFPDPLVYWRAMKKLSPDVVVIRLHGFAFTYMAALTARVCGASVVFYQQQDLSTFAQPSVARSWKALARRIKLRFRLILFSAAWMTPLSSISSVATPPSRCFYVPFAVPVPGRSSVRGEGRIRFLMIGKYQPRKNHLLLLRAAATLSERYDFEVTLVGEVSDQGHESLRRAVLSEILVLGLEDRVRVVDNVPFGRVGDLYRAHDVFVLPASHEPAAISVLEAMGHGMPVICSDTCGTRTYVEEGIDGFVFESGNLCSLANHLERFLAEPTLCEDMSARASASARRQASSEVYYERFMYMISEQFGIGSAVARDRSTPS